MFRLTLHVPRPTIGIFAPLLSVTEGIMLEFLPVPQIDHQAADHTSRLEPHSPHRQRQAVQSPLREVGFTSLQHKSGID